MIGAGGIIPSAARLVLGLCLFALGLSVALACDSRGANDRLTTTVTTNGSVTTIVTGP